MRFLPYYIHIMEQMNKSDNRNNKTLIQQPQQHPPTPQSYLIQNLNSNSTIPLNQINIKHTTIENYQQSMHPSTNYNFPQNIQTNNFQSLHQGFRKNYLFYQNLYNRTIVQLYQTLINKKEIIITIIKKLFNHPKLTIIQQQQAFNSLLQNLNQIIKDFQQFAIHQQNIQCLNLNNLLDLTNQQSNYNFFQPKYLIREMSKKIYQFQQKETQYIKNINDLKGQLEQIKSSNKFNFQPLFVYDKFEGVQNQNLFKRDGGEKQSQIKKLKTNIIQLQTSDLQKSINLGKKIQQKEKNMQLKQSLKFGEEAQSIQGNQIQMMINYNNLMANQAMVASPSGSNKHSINQIFNYFQLNLSKEKSKSHELQLINQTLLIDRLYNIEKLQKEILQLKKQLTNQKLSNRKQQQQKDKKIQELNDINNEVSKRLQYYIQKTKQLPSQINNKNTTLDQMISLEIELNKCNLQIPIQILKNNLRQINDLATKKQFQKLNQQYICQNIQKQYSNKQMKTKNLQSLHKDVNNIITVESQLTKNQKIEEIYQQKYINLLKLQKSYYQDKIKALQNTNSVLRNKIINSLNNKNKQKQLYQQISFLKVKVTRLEQKLKMKKYFNHGYQQSDKLQLSFQNFEKENKKSQIMKYKFNDKFKKTDKKNLSKKSYNQKNNSINSKSHAQQRFIELKNSLINRNQVRQKQITQTKRITLFDLMLQIKKNNLYDQKK